MAAYLKPAPNAERVDLLLADALSPKGEWSGPYVPNIFGTGYVQAPGSSGYRAFWSPGPFQRKLLGKRPSQTNVVVEDIEPRTAAGSLD